MQFYEDEGYSCVRDAEVLPGLLRPMIYASKPGNQKCIEVVPLRSKIADSVIDGYRSLIQHGYECIMIVDSEHKIVPRKMLQIKKYGIGLAVLDPETNSGVQTMFESGFLIDEFEISPDTKPENKQIVPKLMRLCGQNVFIVERWTSKRWLTVIDEVLKTRTFINRVQILTCNSNKITNAYKIKLEELVSNFETVEIEVRILDTNECEKIHDRYLIGDFCTWQYAGIDSIYRGQSSTIKKVKEPKLKRLWKYGRDLLVNWEDIFVEERETI